MTDRIVAEDGPRLVGRDRELERLVALVDAAREGQPGIALITGEAGIGKTRLVREVAERAMARDVRVLLGEGMALATPPAYLPIIEALRSLLDERTPAELAELAGPWARHLAVLLPELARIVDPVEGDDRSALFAAVRDLLGRIARERATVLVIEDVHWADPASLDLLAYLARTLEGQLLLVLTFRRTHDLPGLGLRRWAAELERATTPVHVALGPLGDRDLSGVVETITGATPAEDHLARLAAATGGNPFYLQELLAGPGDDLSTGLFDLLTLRLDGLGHLGRAVVEAVAVAGGRAAASGLAAVTDLSSQELDAGQREALAAGVLVEDPERSGWTFRHGLLAEAALAALPPTGRARLHSAWADVLAEDPDPTAQVLAEIASHRDASGDRERAVPAALVAADAADRVLAYELAEQNYGRALRLWGGDAVDGHERHEVLERAANAAFLSGEPERAVTWLGEALDAVDDRERAAVLHARLGQYQHFANDIGGAARSLSRARELAAAGPPTRARAQVLRIAAMVAMLGDRPDEAITLAEEGIAAARDTGAPEVEAFLLGILGASVAFGTGDIDAALGHVRAGRRIAETVGDPELLCRLPGNEVMVLSEAGRYEAALERSREAVARFDRSGFRHRYGVPARLHRFELEHQLGYWRDAGRTLREIAALHPAPATRPHLLVQRAELELGRGRLDRAAQDLAEAQTHEGGDMLAIVRTASVRAELELWSGQPEAARATVRGLLARPLPDGVRAELSRVLAVGLRAEADLAWSASIRDDQEALAEARATARELSGRLEAIAERLPLAPVAVWAATGAAELARALGDDEEARWEVAVAAWDGLQVPYQAAYARFRLAEALLQADHPSDRADELLRRAAAASRDLGARPLLDEVAGLARRARIDLASTLEEPTPDPAPDPLDGFGLTEREREVLDLVADGHTNRGIAEQLFVTEKTVEHHVTSVLRKLGVTNRVQAATAVHRLTAGR